MKQFLLKTTRYLLVTVLLSGIIIGGFISRKPEFFLGPAVDYFQCQYQYGQINKKTGFTSIIIGDSRGNASINPRQLGEKWINLSIPGSDFFEGYITLKRYLQHNKVDTLVMVYGMSYISEYSRWFNLRTIPYRFISYGELKELEQLERKYNYLFHNRAAGHATLRYDQFVRELKYWHSPFSYRETFLDGLNNCCFSQKKTARDKQRVIAQLSEYRGYTNFGGADSNNTDVIDAKLRFEPGQINQHYLEQIMRLAEANDIAVYLVNPPMNQASFNTYNKSLYESTINQFLEGLQKKYSRLCVLQTEVWLPNTMFGDQLHVNKRGTSSFSANVRARLGR
ncbi:hypothetical protein A4H97_08410 [Niastella yeongjuensis]|uniref:DUF1574 domain-containing protein n=1 Tax=Niastella yeongjuensis TaxID=354355 RepID=A0A1V9EN38_9BACT|nr:hypothetical protein [Niastella yeongjuensis]OQP47501.1 hypothetical protein A4H97_08410 [Niastella yeongjuensis]SEN86992.1 hypothetical protein SAMN05660816_01709 [Niastella yeongjuensis]